MIPAREALERLQEGDKRCVAGQAGRESEIIEQLIRKEGLAVVGAEYSLETGVVDFFDGVPGR
jgi:carbonic anhydrase